MQQIAFTQYLRPNGRQEIVHIERPDDIAAQAEKIVAAGFALECEVLMTGHVSFSIAGDKGDVDIEVVPNGPGVPDAIDRMITRFSERREMAKASS